MQSIDPPFDRKKYNFNSFISVAGIGDSLISNQYTANAGIGLIGNSRRITGFGAWIPYACYRSGGKCYADIYAFEGNSGKRTDEVYALLSASTATEVWGVAETIEIGIAARLPNIVVEQTGTNDLTQSIALEKVIANKIALWEYIRMLGLVPIAMSLFPRDDGLAATVPVWNAAIQVAAESRGIRYCDAYTTCANPDGTWKTGYIYHNGANDALGLHPSMLGSMAIGEVLAITLSNAINSGVYFPRIAAGTPATYSQAYRAGPGIYYKQFVDGAIPSLTGWAIRYDPNSDSSIALSTPTQDISGGGTVKMSRPSDTVARYTDYYTTPITVAAGEEYIMFYDVQMNDSDAFCSLSLEVVDRTVASASLYKPMQQYAIAAKEAPVSWATGLMRFAMRYKIPAGINSVSPFFVFSRSAGGLAGGEDSFFVSNVGNIRIL